MAYSRNEMLQNQFAQLQAKPKTNQNMGQQLMPNKTTADMDGVSPYALDNPDPQMPQMMDMPAMPGAAPVPMMNPATSAAGPCSSPMARRAIWAFSSIQEPLIRYMAGCAWCSPRTGTE